MTRVCCAGSSLSVLPGQRGDLPPLLHTEATRPVAATERREALVGNARRPRHKLGTQEMWEGGGGFNVQWMSGGGRFQRLTATHLQEAQPLLIVEPLHRCPEPPDHNVVVVVTCTHQDRAVTFRAPHQLYQFIFPSFFSVCAVATCST